VATSPPDHNRRVLSIPAEASVRGRRHQLRRAAVKSKPASSAANVVPSIWTCAVSPMIGGSWKLPFSSRFDSSH
jgi:hypothetical protein